MPQPIQLLGTKLEGGGQLFRIAVGVSALTGTAIRISKIRGNRQGVRGLKQQHLTCVKWLSKACNAQTLGAEKKSLDLDFRPGHSDRYPLIEEQIDIGSPGSVSLTLQSILPFLFFSPSPGQGAKHITIKGGVNVDLSPSFEYVQQVLAPTLELIGLTPIKASLGKREWTQKNQAISSVNFTIQPLSLGTKLPAFNLRNRGSVTHIHATIIAPARYQPELQRLVTSAIEECIRLGHLDLDAATSEKASIYFTLETPGSTKTIYVLLVAHTSTGYRLGRDRFLSKLSSSSASSASTFSRKSTSTKSRSKSQRRGHEEHTGDANTSEALSSFAETIVGDLADELAHGGCVDTFMRDQLVVYQALAEGRSYVDGGQVHAGEESEGRARKASLHAQTAEWVCGELLGQSGVHFDGEGGCQGVGWVVGEGREEAESGNGKAAIETERLIGETQGLAKELEETNIS
ncbi:MAG: hypothetical protein M1821_003120 [Bathelium mastoideum]|nr:MAG: hypothetical protein M1821_003120 [Bathelium mastoideum]KAI9688200.1 MAG: hypothetical protein M1822_001706 [Bathelium mastoideum]